MDPKFSQLRKEAEQFLLGNYTFEESKLAEEDVKKIFQELQVHQIELEMQNDELRLANEELELERGRFSGIYDLAPIGYFILDKAGIVEDVNTTGASLLGRAKKNIIGNRLQSYILAGYADTFYIFLHKVLNSAGSQSCQLKILSNTGAVLDVQIEGINIFNVLITKTQCYLAIIDITQRISSEQKLFETKNRLQLALEASHAGTWEYDIKTGYFILDDANFKICGVTKESFDGHYRSFLKLVHPDDRDLVDGSLRGAINQDKELNIDCRVLIAGQICHISVRGHLITDQDNNKRFLGTMTDVTNTKVLEQETDLLKTDQHKNIAAAILQTEENERKRISESLHDSVSQLLYGIKLNLQQIKINNDNETALNTINSLLGEAVKETRNISFELAPSVLRDFGLPATIDELAKRLSTAQLQITAKVTGLSRRLSLAAELVIFRLIQELLNNCIKHAEASKVKVEIKKGKTLEIEVKDNGKGFDISEQEKLTGGSGLSSIRNRLDVYNGHMDIESSPGKGTVVSISLKL